MVVGVLLRAEGHDSFSQGLEVVLAPELVVIDAMAAFDLPLGEGC
jgi:hypothetical protein